MFFGVADKLEVLTRNHDHGVHTLILDLDQVIYMDSTAGHALEIVNQELLERRVTLLVCGAHPQAASLLQRSGLRDTMGAHRVFAGRAEALAHAHKSNATT